MLNSYHRRAFLALALVACEPALPRSARADDTPTLWEALSHVERSAPGRNGSAPGSLDPDEPVRVPLGSVPGFTLSAQDRIGEANVSTGGKHKKEYRGMLAPVSQLWDRFLNATGSKFDMKGDATMSFRKDSISGGDKAASTFQDQNYFGQGSNGVYTNASLNVDATLFKYFHYSTTISNSPFRNPNENRVKLDYNTKKTRFQMGDINAGFQGNSLIEFNRYLNGVELTNQWSKQLKTITLASKTKAETKTLSTPGNDSAGPYYIFAGQIVDGSAHVRVDNRDMVPDKDYTLNSNTGELFFKNGNVILHSQTIAVTYEALGYNQSQGSIYGFRTEYTPRGSTNFGMTYVVEQSRGSSQFTTRKQLFQGSEAAWASYTLDAPIDTSKPLQVLVNGIPLVRGLNTNSGDYVIDPNFPQTIRVRNPVPALQQVEVQYVPLDTSPTPGNRSVLGLDGRMGLGKWGSVNVETALSGLSLTGRDIRGKAAQVRLDLTPFKSLTTHITVRDVGAAFSSIQTPGFNRNEKSVDIAGEYSPFSKLHLTFDWQKAKRPSYAGLGNISGGQFAIATNGNDTYNQYSLSICRATISRQTISSAGKASP